MHSYISVNSILESEKKGLIRNVESPFSILSLNLNSNTSFDQAGLLCACSFSIFGVTKATICTHACIISISLISRPFPFRFFPPDGRRRYLENKCGWILVGHGACSTNEEWVIDWLTQEEQWMVLPWPDTATAITLSTANPALTGKIKGALWW